MLVLELDLPGGPVTLRLGPGRMVLGRGKYCDLVVDHDSISRRHLELEVGAQEVFLADLGSRNGLLWKGQRARKALLRPEESVVIGRVQCTLREAASSPADRSGPVPVTMGGLLRRLAAAPVPGPAEESSRLRPGSMVGSYLLQRELEGGTSMQVYEARDCRTGRLVAFKAIATGNPAEREADLARELAGAAGLDHPNLIVPRDQGSWEGGVYFVEEWLSGETLEKRLRRGPLPLQDAMRISLEVGRGLARAHERGLIHGTLRPSSVFLERNGTTRVLDLGLARIGRGGRGAPRAAPGYAPPEQLAGERENAGFDVFACGVMLYEMATGELPAPLPTSGERLAIVFALVAPAPRQALVGLLARALSPARGDRFPDGLAWARALEDVSIGVGTDRSQESTSLLRRVLRALGRVAPGGRKRSP